MNRNIPRLSITRLHWFALALTGLSLLAGVGPAMASAPSWGIRAALVGQTELPGDHYTYALRPGMSVQDAVTLYNYQRQPQTLQVYGADLVNAPGGGLAPLQVYDTMRGVGAWLHFASLSVTIPAGGQVSVPFHLIVPLGTTPGAYYGAVVATASGPRAVVNGLALVSRAALIVHLTVPGATNASLKVGALTATQTGSDEAFSIMLTNTGNVMLTITGSVLVRVAGQGRPIILPLTPSDIYVIPNGHLTLHATWHGVPAFGPASAVATIDATLSGHPMLTASSQTLRLSFMSWPTVITGGVIAVSLLGLVIVLWPRLRQYRASRRQERILFAQFRAQQQAQRDAAARKNQKPPHAA